MRTLLLGGARSGKSRAAEQRAIAWLGQPGRSACLLATAQAGDAEMRERIARHQADRALRVPALQVFEAHGEHLPALVRQHSQPDCLVVVDCLTLWLTQLLMPLSAQPQSPLETPAAQALVDALLLALADSAGPVVLVSNEISLGVLPMSRQARQFVDALGRLHQAVAARCEVVRLMVAGIEVPVKGGL
jgi:adenosylcobinamide kinase / adenosylcobinamide-phosphate guanylyltransferase